MVGDAAFKKEELKGHSLRGALYLRVSGQNLADFTKGGVVHVLDFSCKAQRHVTRSTFSAELFGGCDTADQGFVVGTIIHEISKGVVSKADARSLRERGGYSIPMVLYIDALSVYAAVTATNIKVPAEKSLLSHVQFVRECLDNKSIAALAWIDTRDMYADGMTKGAVDRDALHEIMDGHMHFRHEFKIWAAKANASGSHLAE
jgi:hypothetical protein